ncbi:MAG: TlpA family protein disulfide reductase [Flavobacterium micromati]|nr:TlpA family protein disulfide reductase [Flavobacterium micromati]
MKKTIIVTMLVLNCVTILAQKSFFYNLTATLPTNTEVTKLYIAYEIAGVKYKDSLDFTKKQLQLNKILAQPVAASIATNKKTITPLSVILANNTVAVMIASETIVINKSTLQDDFLYLTKNDRIRPTYFPLYGELTAKNDTVGLNKLGVIFEDLKIDDIKRSFDYFKANKTSLLSLFSFNRFTTFFADYSKVANDFTLLPSWAKNSPDGKNIAAKIEGAKSARVNTPAKKFTQQSSTGQKISSDTFEGKYILLDFWASWCSPCRKEHPNLIKIYEAFKDKNFEIISVSVDSENDNWLTAIAKDKITWTQLSDLKGQQNDIAVKYGVQSIPTNFLIDQKGIIIDKNLTGEALNDRLIKLLGN